MISGPSGSGKTSVVKKVLVSDPSLKFLISHTTRRPRKGEVHGREYYFISREEFEKMIKEGEFLEWAEVYGNLYGTSRRELEEKSRNSDVILDIDVQGAESIKKIFPESCRIFLLPPSLEELEKRLEKRGDTSPEEMKKRLKIARWEISRYDIFDYLVVNENLDRCVEDVLSIIRAERLKKDRMKSKLSQLGI